MCIPHSLTHIICGTNAHVHAMQFVSRPMTVQRPLDRRMTGAHSHRHAAPGEEATGTHGDLKDGVPVYSDSRAGVCVCAHVRVRAGMQIPCSGCGVPTLVDSGRHHMCHACNYARRYPPAAASAPPPPPSPPSPPPPPLFDSHAGLHTPLPLVQRSAIVTLHKDGQSHATVAQKVGTSLPAVSRWIARYEESKDVVDASRSGRPRCTYEALDTAIAFTSRVEPFTPPRGIKRKHDLDISSD
jgi:hypothetical protein